MNTIINMQYFIALMNVKHKANKIIRDLEEKRI